MFLKKVLNVKSWDDFSVDGHRINRLIRNLETRSKKCKSDEKFVRYCNAIGFLTSKKIEVLKIHHNIEEILEQVRAQKRHRKAIEKSFH